jgi:hypothetical protein
VTCDGSWAAAALVNICHVMLSVMSGLSETCADVMPCHTMSCQRL